LTLSSVVLSVYAMVCLIAVNVWRGMPFFAITLLAGLQTVNPDLHEVAEIDGTNAWQRFWRVTLPLIKPIMLVVVLFSMIATFADFQLIYVLTRWRPVQQHPRVRDVRLRDRDARGEAGAAGIHLAHPLPLPAGGHRASALVHPAERVTMAVRGGGMGHRSVYSRASWFLSRNWVS
jgi:hypothetical protein